MPVVQPDFSEAIDVSPIEEGTYPAKMTVIKHTTSKSNNAMLECSTALMINGKERERKVWLLTSGKGSGSFQQFLRACGRDDLAGGSVPFDTDELLNINFMAIVTKQTEGQYAGRDQISGFLKA